MWTKRSFLVESLVQYSFARDLSTGLKYIHDSEIKVHGQLRSDTCYVNEHWVCRLSCFGLSKFYEQQAHINACQHDSVEQKSFILDYSGSLLNAPRLSLGCDESCTFDYSKLFWTAPELVREIARNGNAEEYTQQADIYAAGMILKELITLEEPYERELKQYSAKAIIEKIIDYAWMKDPFRPYIKDVSKNHLEKMVPIVESCLEEVPSHRPTAKILLRGLRRSHANP
ncbi:receptor-type guanylate cyclase gcy-13-like [Littorina saxatilis]|uniref:receptor-type guanylate cyclase gcy-13-like n=1 Tax=Littorina saxatilis TaxID=31220 RepID=UPI0038B4718E